MKKLILTALAGLAVAGGAWADTYPKKMLLEQFTTIYCSNCPDGLIALNKAVDKDPNVVWVAHHVGFGTDELTVKDSERLMSFGVTGAPNVMFDRAVSEQTGRLVFVPHAYDTETLRAIIDSRLAEEANVGIELSTEFDDDTRALTVDVKLTRNADLPADALLTVQLVENAVKAKRAQAGSNGYYHSNVLRRPLTDILGDEIEWADDNTATVSYSFSVPEEWRANFLFAQAFVSRPQSRVAADNEVLNAEKTGYVTDKEPEAGIEGVAADFDAAAPAEWYTLQGIRVAEPAAPGIYVRRQGSTTAKVIVR